MVDLLPSIDSNLLYQPIVEHRATQEKSQGSKAGKKRQRRQKCQLYQEESSHTGR